MEALTGSVVNPRGKGSGWSSKRLRSAPFRGFAALHEKERTVGVSELSRPKLKRFLLAVDALPPRLDKRQQTCRGTAGGLADVEPNSLASSWSMRTARSGTGSPCTACMPVRNDGPDHGPRHLSTGLERHDGASRESAATWNARASRRGNNLLGAAAVFGGDGQPTASKHLPRQACRVDFTKDTLAALSAVCAGLHHHHRRLPGRAAPEAAARRPGLGRRAERVRHPHPHALGRRGRPRRTMHARVGDQFWP